MKIAYFDESGIGDINEEPFVVVAGILVDPDSQIRSIESTLKEIADEFVPKEKRNGFVFHAKDLYGGRNAFDSTIFTEFTEEKRKNILQRICQIPKLYNVPICLGYVDRAAFNATLYGLQETSLREIKSEEVITPKQLKPKELVIKAQALASMECTAAVEKYMRMCRVDEVAMIVYENNQQAQSTIKSSHNLMRDPECAQFEAVNDWRKYLPFRQVIEIPLFAEKSECALLQIADAVAWAINRKLRRKQDCDYFYEPIDGGIICRRGHLGGIRWHWT